MKNEKGKIINEDHGSAWMKRLHSMPRHCARQMGNGDKQEDVCIFE